MTGPIRVLIADDSSAVRGVLSKVIGAEPKLELVGSASNGAIAVEKAVRLDPDVIILDIDMPVMTGLEAVVEIRKQLPNTPIIMFSTLTEHGADVTLEALSKGASDYAAKPTNIGTSVSMIDQVRQELVTKIVGFGSKAARPAAPVTARPPVARKNATGRIDALLVGSSTGGPAALEKVLSRIPAPLPVPILMVQHMPATFTGVLAARLNQACAFPVVEAQEGMAVDAGSCYLAPGGYHMQLISAAGRIHVALDEGPKVKSCRPSVDVLFDSAAEIYQGAVLATVLTGMGDDGLDASKRLVELGVDVIVQDEATSVVWGMPGAIARAGLASQCLPVEDIAGALLTRVSTARPGVPPRPTSGGALPRPTGRASTLVAPERGR